MIVRKTSKNQLTLPTKVVEQFPDVEYFDVTVDETKITLAPVRPARLLEVQSRMEPLRISAREIREAVTWARTARGHSRR